MWVKRGNLSASWNTLFGRAGSGTQLQYDSTGQLVLYQGGTNAGGTTPVYRDPSSWYHVVLNYSSSTSGTLYVNGSQVRTYTTTNAVNVSGATYYIGQSLNAGENFDGYMAEVNFIDGQALTPSSFGSTNATTGVWQPAKYTGTYGTNGFYLPFTNTTSTSTLGNDLSGNGNTWTVNNISLTAGSTYDSMTDVPTLTSATTANYATLNPLMKYGSNLSWNNGNLQLVKSSSSTQDHTYGTIGSASGKFYWEMTISAFAGSAPYIYFGVARGLDLTTAYDNTAIWYASDGTKSNRASASYNQAYGATYTTNDVIAVALDLDSGTITFYKNNVSQGIAYSNLGTYPGLYMPYVNFDGTSVTATFEFNFGQRPFTYTPPSGYVALNTFNLPTSTIVKGNTVMDATTFTGTGASQSVVNTAAFKPDLVWAKSRGSAQDNWLADSNRGANNILYSNLTNAETVGAGVISSFNSNGFGVTSVFTNAVAYVGWQWQAGQGSTSSNTDGTITSTVSKNATAGFSVVTWTGNGTGGATIGHGLGVAPSMVISKRRDFADDWSCYHVSLGGTKYIDLNSTVAAGTSIVVWNNTNPSSTVVTLGTSNRVNASSGTYVAYCWTPIAGFSAFGSYTGNGSTDGPFVYTGFRPKFVLVKCSNTVFEWWIQDTSRSTYNASDSILQPNSSGSEINSGGYTIDILSNGFKCRSSGSSTNGNGNTYIYAAFAENPFKNALAR
jgi:hypothetical protein